MEFLEVALMAARKASNIIIEYYRANNYQTLIKEDDSPVTEADLAANLAIIEIIKGNYPSHSILSEENEDDKDRLNSEYVWIIDPLDGTKDFIHRTDEFTVNIALVYNHQPIVGVIAIPATNEIYYGEKDKGSFHLKDGITTRLQVNLKKTNLKVLRSRFHFGEKEKKYFATHPQFSELVEVGSSLKACYIAAGKADVYPKLGPGTKEWDVAPSALIVREAGGTFVKPNGELFTFNRSEVQNLEGFIIMNQLNEDLLLTNEFTSKD